ncbi:hypothetical protein ACHAWX_002722 [Stephanocyclus meneghinianus]
MLKTNNSLGAVKTRMIQDCVNLTKATPRDTVLSPSSSISKQIVMQDFGMLLHKNDSSPAAKEIDPVFVKGGKANILYRKVAINSDICRKKFDKFTFTFSAKGVSDLESNIFGERVLLTSSLFQTPKESVAMKQVKGIDKNLIMAEHLFAQLFSGQQIEVEVQARKSLYFFKEHVQEVIEPFKVHQLVSIGVLRSEKLQKIPHMVSETGYLTNEGKVEAGIHAFNLESLSKLLQSKNADCKFAVLGNIMETLTSKWKRNL